MFRSCDSVILYRLGNPKNFNRIYRLCYSFGVRTIYLYDTPLMSPGRVFSAAGKVQVETITSIDEVPGKVVALETTGKSSAVKLTHADAIMIGGENVSISGKLCRDRVRIETVNGLCLTADQALAIGLYIAGGSS